MDRIPLLTEILTLNPAEPFARYGLAMALAEANRLEEALAHFAHLHTHSPDYVPAYQMAAQLLLRHDRHEEARASLHAGIAAANRSGNHHAIAEMQALLDDSATA